MQRKARHTPEFYTGHLKHELGGFGGVLFLVFVREVDDGPDARLDDEFGAFVAGEERHKESAVAHISAVLVQDGVHLRVTN